MVDDPKTEVGRAVRGYLTATGTSQKELAERMGMSRPYVSQVVTGVRKANPEWVNVVSQALNLPPAQARALHRAAAKDNGFDIDLGPYPAARKS